MGAIKEKVNRLTNANRKRMIRRLRENYTRYARARLTREEIAATLSQELGFEVTVSNLTLACKKLNKPTNVKSYKTRSKVSYLQDKPLALPSPEEPMEMEVVPLAEMAERSSPLPLFAQMRVVAQSLGNLYKELGATIPVELQSIIDG